MQCPVPGVVYDTNDVVVLNCSVEYAGYTAPSLNWTDGGGKKLDANYTKTLSTVS